MVNESISRRRFLHASAVALGAAARATAAPPAGEPRWPLLGFTKPFANLSFDDTADLVAEVGWSGIDCPVRAKGAHIAPERADQELPKMAEALQKRGKSLAVVTTDILRVNPAAEKLLRVVAKQGVRKYRLGFAHYPKNRPVPEVVNEYAAAWKDLAALNLELGLQGIYQNHSGADYIGGPIWDLWLMLKDLDPAALGVCFDIGQAMIEGGLSWPVQVRLTEQRWGAVQLKDFIWEKQATAGWQPRWVPVGEGRVPRKFFQDLRNSKFAGPIIQHHEHLEPDAPRSELLAELKQDFNTLKDWVS